MGLFSESSCLDNLSLISYLSISDLEYPSRVQIQDTLKSIGSLQLIYKLL